MSVTLNTVNNEIVNRTFNSIQECQEFLQGYFEEVDVPDGSNED